MTHADEIVLELEDSAWPVDDGLPEGSAHVNVSVDRELVASTLPGQIRARSGFSVGSATCTLGQSSQQMTPWSIRRERVSTGHPAALFAVTQDGGREPMGAWQVKGVSGALTSSSVEVELAESQYGGRSHAPRFPAPSGNCDPIWVIYHLAKQLGFHAVPPPVPSTYLHIPFLGGAEDSDVILNTARHKWSMVTGVPSLSSASMMFNTGFSAVDTVEAESAPAISDIFITLNVVGEVVLDIDEMWSLKLGRTSIGVADDPSGPWDTRSFGRTSNNVWPNRIQLQLRRQYSEIDGWTTKVRARGGVTSGFTGWLDVGSLNSGTAEIVSVSPDGGISDWHVTYEADSNLWATPTAHLNLLEATVDAPWTSAPDVWAALQEVCGAFGAAGWVSRHGVLTVMNRHQMAGANRRTEPIDVNLMADDIKWTLEDDDFADRLEVTWHPVTMELDYDWNPTSPEEVEKDLSDEMLHVPAGGSSTIVVEFDGFVRKVYPFHPTSNGDSQPLSDWSANTNHEGTGANVVYGITIKAEHLSPSRVHVTIKNTNTFDVWMDTLNVRGAWPATQDSPQVVARGVSAHIARNALSVDLGKLVQTKEDAERLADYLWSRVDKPRWRASSVRLPHDWDRDLGDILALTHPETGLSVNAVIVRVHVDANAGRISQTVDLVLLPPTWEEFDAAWADGTWDDFDALWADSTYDDYDNNPIFTEY